MIEVKITLELPSLLNRSSEALEEDRCNSIRSWESIKVSITVPVHSPSQQSEEEYSRWRWLNRSLWFFPTLPVLLLTVLVLQKPHQVSEHLLRLGGGIIKSATQNVEKVALFGGVLVFLLWIGIAVAAAREKNRSSEHERS